MVEEKEELSLTESAIKGIHDALERAANNGCNEIRFFKKGYESRIGDISAHFYSKGFKVFEELYEYEQMVVISFAEKGDVRRLFLNQ